MARTTPPDPLTVLRSYLEASRRQTGELPLIRIGPLIEQACRFGSIVVQERADQRCLRREVGNLGADTCRQRAHRQDAGGDLHNRLSSLRGATSGRLPSFGTTGQPRYASRSSLAAGRASLTWIKNVRCLRRAGCPLS